jgi:hypothetical protein
MALAEISRPTMDPAIEAIEAGDLDDAKAPADIAAVTCARTP